MHFLLDYQIYTRIGWSFQNTFSASQLLGLLNQQNYDDFGMLLLIILRHIHKTKKISK